jgi:hypothetical protein
LLLCASPEALVSFWLSRTQRATECAQQVLAELKNAPSMDVSMTSVALLEPSSAKPTAYLLATG